jgi:hypothetical protein
MPARVSPGELFIGLSASKAYHDRPRSQIRSLCGVWRRLFSLAEFNSAFRFVPDLQYRGRVCQKARPSAGSQTSTEAHPPRTPFDDVNCRERRVDIVAARIFELRMRSLTVDSSAPAHRNVMLAACAVLSVAMTLRPANAAICIMLSVLGRGFMSVLRLARRPGCGLLRGPIERVRDARKQLNGLQVVVGTMSLPGTFRTFRWR